MRKLTLIITIALSIVVAAVATAQVRGHGRLQGIVTDKATGKPVAGAKVTVSAADQETQPIVTKTDSRGHWSALGLVGGTWNIDIVADGYDTTRGSASVSEMTMSPLIKTAMAPAVQQEQQPEMAPVANPIIPEEAVNAINAGQELLKVKAGDTVTGADNSQHAATADEVKANAAQAVTQFEKAISLLPTDKEEAQKVRLQLMGVMSRAYYNAGDLPKAISTLEQLNAADPSDPNAGARKLLLVNLYLENHDLEKGRTLLEQVPAGTVTDPTIYMNIGILFLNQQKPADALKYFSDAVKLDAKNAAAYYYRGLAEVQLKKVADARTDFQQVIALSPDSSEARDSKQMLDALSHS
ncbi:MAG: tetratricopeptide repeat protein [Acidobacteria bacterium]|nr:tetratricopeptide repeat protein [Acidobacteriota bacterium]MBV9479068.1 tetratricopeptide repeat protein [Acidobacteriota bacterium]